MKLGGVRQRGYLLGLLTLVTAFSYVDRTAIGLLLQYIKTDLHLSDTQLGLMTGIAFSLFYAVMGVPIARWADRGNRIHVLVVTTVAWSIAVVCGAFARSFLQLLAARVVVAVGEAGAVPTSMSLIADTFSREERPRAVSIYRLAVPVSGAVGYFVAGWLNEQYGWRQTIAVLAAPGLLLALLLLLTLRDRRSAERPAPDVTFASPSQTLSVRATPRIGDVLGILRSNRSFCSLTAGYAVALFFGAGMSSWNPTFYVRSFGLSSGQLGTWFAVVFSVTGVAGLASGGFLATRWAPRNERLQLRWIAGVYAVSGLLDAFSYLSPRPEIALALMGVVAFLSGAIQGPLFATIQSLVPDRIRATSISLFYLISNLVGLGFAPLAVGMLSDHLTGWLGPEALRWSLLILTPGYAWVAWFIWRAGRTVSADLTTAEESG